MRRNVILLHHFVEEGDGIFWVNPAGADMPMSMTLAHLQLHNWLQLNAIMMQLLPDNLHYIQDPIW